MPADPAETSTVGTPEPPREWDANAYDHLPLPHERWGRQLLNKLQLQGNERVLELGAGTGRDTQHLLDLLPHGHVIAVDASEAMLQRLRDRLAGCPAERLTALRADIRGPLPDLEPVDVVVSVATLHWVPDHPSVFAHVAGVMCPGGRLLAEWGGAGNLASIDAALADLGLTPVTESLNFATVTSTRDALSGAGFTQIEVERVPDPARFEPGEQLESFLATVVLGTVLDPLDPADRASVVRGVATRLGEPVVDYVRLQASAYLDTAPGTSRDDIRA